MRIVVDTNIIFSAILNTISKISRIILYPKSNLNFYFTFQLEDELKEHWGKLLKISNYTENELYKTSSILLSKIKLIHVALIPSKILINSAILLKNIDEDDTEFVALATHIKGKLWTGDKVLAKGLKKKSWEQLISTEDLFYYLFKK